MDSVNVKGLFKWLVEIQCWKIFYINSAYPDFSSVLIFYTCALNLYFSEFLFLVSYTRINLRV